MSSSVARYYDRNTLRFLLVGRGRDSWAIHRQLWGPGVETHRDASNYVNVLLEERIRSLVPGGPTTVLDLGCGVGGTLFHLATRFPTSRLTGVTISTRQLAIAERVAARRGLAGRCLFRRDDFLTMRLGLEADVALAVESFVHAAEADAFFTAVAAHLREGGHLLLVDDFLTRDEVTSPSEERALIEAFREGWRAPGVTTVESCLAAAGRAGLEPLGDAAEDAARGVDLTPLIRLGRPRDRVIAALSPLFRGLGVASIPFFGNMVGGDALQAGLRRGLLGYRLLVLRKGRSGS